MAGCCSNIEVHEEISGDIAEVSEEDLDALVVNVFAALGVVVLLDVGQLACEAALVQVVF